MIAKLLNEWDRVRSSFWFLPSVMAGGAVGLAFATVALDASVTEPWVRANGLVFAGGAEGASAVLGAIAGSMITIAGVVFSLTLLALSLASSQFGPRLLRNFMRDTSNQVVLGTFVATFLYCLLVLRTIRYEGDREFVPHLSVTIGVVLAVASMGVLIYFVHHVSVSIQADELVAVVGAELLQAIDRLFPEQLGEGLPRDAVEPEGGGLPPEFTREARPIVAKGDGYLQRIDAEALLELAVEADLLLRIEFRPGHYVIAGTPLLYAWPGVRVEEKLATEVNGLFILGSQRTPAQDVEYSVSQLVEIAARALSPGVNDPFTAVTCVDRLGSALGRLAQREMPSPYRCDEQQKLRVVAPAITFAAVLDAALNQIRQYSRTSAAVTIRLLDTIALIARSARRAADRAALLRHAEMIARGGREGLPEEEDRREVEDRFQAACLALKKVE